MDEGGLKIYVKEGSGNEQLSLQGPDGEHREGGRGFFYQGLRDTVIFGFLLLDPEDVRSLSLGAIWKFSNQFREVK